MQALQKGLDRNDSSAVHVQFAITAINDVALGFHPLEQGGDAFPKLRTVVAAVLYFDRYCALAAPENEVDLAAARGRSIGPRTLGPGVVQIALELRGNITSDVSVRRC